MNGWIRTEDQMPEDEVLVLCWAHGGYAGEPVHLLAWNCKDFSPGEWTDGDSTFMCKESIKYWKPIGGPPE